MQVSTLGCDPTHLQGGGGKDRVQAETTNRKKQATAYTLLIETVCISMWNIQTGTVVIRILKLSLSDSKCVESNLPYRHVYR
jgi:hypothetical protein